MLGRVERESPVHAALAAALGGWSATDPLDAGSWDSAPASDEELLDLGGLTDTLATIAVMGDLAAVVQIGNPAAPEPVIEDYLLRGPANLMVVAAEAVPAQWVWVGGAGGVVVVDEAGLRDCREHLRNLGNPLRLVPAQATVAERMAAAGPDGSMVIERDRAPQNWTLIAEPEEITGSALLWYGLIDSYESLPQFDDVAQVWLAFGPSGDYRGSLRETLGEFANLGLDLTHLRSQREASGPDGEPRPHHFFTAFSCPNSAVLQALITALHKNQVRHRVLAIIPGQNFQPEPLGLTPRWS